MSVIWIWNFQDKIARFDVLVEENQRLKAENYVQSAQLSKVLASEEHNKRLVSEIGELQAARDEAMARIESLNYILTLKKSEDQPEKEFTVINRLKEKIIIFRIPNILVSCEKG